MRLKKLVVHGFKSFADRTEFVFDSPITGIVGPNGCGKSNVVDAFKWVLGEQSAKSLRGDAMMDVIFNGSGGRKPSGMAEVVLVFENPEQPSGARVLGVDTEEVSVGRRLFRDGASEYHLNNKTSRLKDVRELFLDTGVGVDAYSVIEQGRVSALLESNPAERRLIFEEAAGVSKYKVKKKETQRKLEKVDQNLLRANDIVEEVEKRLRSVKVQAGKARNYQEHSNRLAELRLEFSLQAYHTQHAALAEVTQSAEEAQFRLDDAAADLSRSETDLTEKREKAENVARQKQALEYELVQARAAVQSAQQRQHYAEQQLQQSGEQIAGFERDQLSLNDKLQAVNAALTDETARLQSLNSELAQQRAQIEQKQQAFRDGQLRLNKLHQEIEQNKSAVLNGMRMQSNVASRANAIEIERKNIAQQQQRLGDRRAVVANELAGLVAKAGELGEKLAAANAEIAEQQRRAEAKKQEIAQHGKQIAKITGQLGSAREHRSGLMSRQKLLKDLEAKREGVSEGVKSVLRRREAEFPFVRGLVADVLRVDVEHAHVIEAALDGRDQWLVTGDSVAALAADEKLNDLEGRVNLLCTDRLSGGTRRDTGLQPERGGPAFGEPSAGDRKRSAHGLQTRVTGDGAPHDWNQHPQRIRLAADLVRVEPNDAAIADWLLGCTAVVDALADANALHRDGPAGWRYVTAGGDVLEADGTLRAGPLAASMGLLSRHAELAAIGQQIAEVDERIARLTAQIDQGTAAAKQLDEEQNALRNAGYVANTARVEVSSAIASNTDKQNALRREEPVLLRELGMFDQQTEKLVAEEQKLLEQKAKLEAEQAAREAAVESLMAEHQALGESLKETGELLTHVRVQLGQVQEQQLAAQQAVQRNTASRGELSQQLERIAASLRDLAVRRTRVEQELVAAKEAETALEQKQSGLSEQIAHAAAASAESADAVKSLAGSVDRLRRDHQAVEQELHQSQVKAGELKVRLETLVTRAAEELQLDLPQKYTSIENYTPAERDWAVVDAEIKELREKIQRLGNVNLDAIADADELEQRQQLLSTQLGDLISSKKQLEELIDQINAESSARFEATFNAVREHFQGMFRKLFGGGKADIYLETELEDVKAIPIPGPDGQMMLPEKKKIDLLDAGIEIIARPPGKQPATISQLSGGEKTMTCIALLMSIFKSKPSPFCILDEVDAALDEANNQRFNLIVQEFLEYSQFIVITHSKRTMQIADVLYGVTMQEQGVSKRVSVKFDQVDAKGRIGEVEAA